jgi:hypothetical protein
MPTFRINILSPSSRAEHGAACLGFGTVLICWSMPAFRRNILSPSSRAEHGDSMFGF